MKKTVKSFTFWFAVISIFIITLNIIGQDSKNIILIGFNPLLLFLDKTCQDFMNSGLQIPTQSVNHSISIYWYIASLLSMSLYGFIIDLIKKGVKLLN